MNGDEGEFSEIFSEDFVFGIMPGFAYGGDHIGLDATNNFFDKLGTHFEFWEVHTDKFIPINEANFFSNSIILLPADEIHPDFAVLYSSNAS